MELKFSVFSFRLEGELGMVRLFLMNSLYANICMLTGDDVDDVS